MNVIIAYLDTMFDAKPQTPRLLEAKAELRAMMEDAYQGLVADGATPDEAAGRVITDFGSLDELAPVLGTSADITRSAHPAELRESTTSEPAPRAGTGESACAPVTVEEAESFAEVHWRTRYRLAAAVALFAASPIPLILLIAAADVQDANLDGGIARVIGVVLLLIAVAIGVVLVVGIAGALAPFARLQRRHFAPNPVVTRWADELALTHEHRRVVSIKAAVLLWIFSAVPILLATLAPPSPLQGLWMAGSIALALLLVAVGMLIVLPAAWARSVADAINRPRVERRRARR